MPFSTKSEPQAKASATFASPQKRNTILCLLLALATLVLYNPVNRHPFVNYDDDRYVTENPHVREGLTLGTARWALTSTEQANWHPLTWISHALDCSLFRLNPVGHHFTNILLHAINAAILFVLLVRTTGSIEASLSVAALFALHPINVESVAWVAERKNVLCTLFFFLTLWAYGWYARKPGWKRYLMVAGLFAAGLASKPMVITLPFLLCLLDYWPLGRFGPDKEFRWTSLVVEKLPLLLLSIASGIITLLAQQAGGSIRSTAEFSFSVRILNAIYAYVLYLWKVMLPARLAPLYPHPGNSISAWRVAVAALILILITAAACKYRNHRYLPVGWFWFLGALVPVIGLVQVGEAAMADRYAYIPLIGIFLIVAFGTAEMTKRKSLRFWPAILATVVLIILPAITHHQIGYWSSNNRLWSHTLEVTDNNFVAENNLAGALILEGKESEAHPHFQAASRINPRDPMSRSNLGTYYRNHGQMREAVREYETAVTLTSDPGLLAVTYANLGAVQMALGEPEKAHQNLQEALRYNAAQFNAWLGLGLLAESQGNLAEAIVDFSRSIEAQPTGPAFLELGRCLAQSGRKTEALQAFDEALKISPGLIEAQKGADELRYSRP